MYRRSDPNFARIASPLNAELKIVEPKKFVHLSIGEMDALATLQQNLIAAPVMAFIRSKRFMTLENDMHDKQIWYGLMQDQPDEAKERLGIGPNA